MLLVDGLKKIVGSVVLPVLGAVPDGAIVFFSGLGANAQEKISVGVGALAGSTILLLTVPWCIAMYVGRVSLLPDKSGATYRSTPRLDPDSKTLTETGVESSKLIRYSGRVMICSSLSYILIMFFLSDTNRIFKTPAKDTSIAVVVLVVCLSFLAYYVWTQFAGSLGIAEYIWRQRTLKEIQDGNLSVSEAFSKVQDIMYEEADQNEQSTLVRKSSYNFDNILTTFFTAYDYNRDGKIDVKELSYLMKQMGEKVSDQELDELIKGVSRGENGYDGQIDREEFIILMSNYIMKDKKSETYSSTNNTQVEVDRDAYGSDVEEMPKFVQDLTPAERKKAILKRAVLMMTLGSIGILIFSDPAVTVMQDFAERLGISAFYISFMLAPLASNFVEVLAAYNYARKKTRQSIEVSLTNLLGAAILNNTFVLAVFMVLIIFKGLKWTFDAETIAIVSVQLIVFLVSLGQTYSVLQGVFILSLYPISIIMIYLLKCK